MFGSQKRNFDILYELYRINRTVFRLRDVALIVGETNFESLNRKLNYYVHQGKLENPRKGIYAKPGYNVEEMAGIIFTPSYVSLEYVLQRSGIIFQFDQRITAISYLSRIIEVEGQLFRYRKMKGEILVNTTGIIRNENHINIASPERAFLDLLYLEANIYFDNINPLNQDIVRKLLPVYESKSLDIRVEKLFAHDTY
jgi:hypothetical protein